MIVLKEENPYVYFRGGRSILLYSDSLLLMGSILRFRDQILNKNLFLKSLKDRVLGAEIDYKGNIYVAQEHGALNLIDQQGNLLNTYVYPNSGFTSLIWAVYEDIDKKLWLGNDKGLAYLDSLKGTIVPIPLPQYNGFESLTQSSIYHIYEKGNKLYLCSSSGLYLWDKDKGAEAHYVPDVVVAHLHEDSNGIFWLATKGNGLIEFDPTRKEIVQTFTTEEGLANNVIYGIYADTHNKLWMSSNWGIMRFDKETYSVTNYTKENGLLDNEFNTLSHHQDKHGTLYFGNQKGLVMFHPDDFKNLEENSPMQITKADKLIRATEEYESIISTILITNQIDLYPSDKGFKLNVALLDYRNPKAHQYAYKIEGISKKWNYQFSPTIIENNIDYGTYTIRVKIKGLGGNWIELEKPITLIVYRPFYLQWWFIILAIGLSLTTFFLIIKRRTRQLVLRQKELEEVVKVRTEKIAQQAEDLKVLDKVKSRFFANISHELRTPLTLILGPISALISKHKKQAVDAAEVQEGLINIKKNGESLLTLVEEILDLSKMEAQKLALDKETIHVVSFVQDIFQAFSKQATYLGIHYKLNSSIQEDLYLLLDKNKVTKLLNNLIANALKFTPSEQHLMVTVNELDKALQFIIEDTGLGIHPDDLPHIFERFYQSKQPNRPAQGGTGIGLALVSEFTKLMHGTITVTSVLDKGSTFKVTLPKQIIHLVDEDKKAVAIPSKLNEALEEIAFVPAFDQKKPTLLIVEDHAEMRDFICSVLDVHYNVITATNGFEGIHALQNTEVTIDLILSDVMMPQMDGFTMLSKIKADPQWRFIPMIMLTARAAVEDKLQALTVGVDDYLTKPFSVEELNIRVANLLRNSIDRKNWLKEQANTVDVDSSSEEANDLLNVDLKWVKKLEEFMIEEIDNENCNTIDLAKKMHLSVGHLRRKLKQLTGLTPLKMFTTVRLNAARTYLERKQFHTVKEISFAVGFQSVEGFSKSYKRHFGKSPSEHLS